MAFVLCLHRPCRTPTINVTRLVATLLAFFFAVGLAAHSLDELNGRPLGTHIPAWVLVAVTVASLAAAVALGIVGVFRVGWALIPFLVLGPLLVVAYNFELFGGVIHNDAGFALAWGSFPVWSLTWPRRIVSRSVRSSLPPRPSHFRPRNVNSAHGHGSSADAVQRWEVRSH